MIGGLTVFLVSLFDEQSRSFITRTVQAAIAQPVRAIFMASGIALIAYAFWDQLLNLFGIQSKKRLESDVKTWLDAFQYSVKRLQNPNAYFEFQVTPKSGESFNIGNYRDTGHYLQISARGRLSGEEYKTYGAMPDDEQSLMRINAIMELCRSGVGYCVFRAIVGTDSGASWAVIPGHRGHRFRCIVGSSRL